MIINFNKNLFTVIFLLPVMVLCNSCSKKPVDDAASVVMSYLSTIDEKQLITYLDSSSKKKIENIKNRYATVYPFLWVHHSEQAQWDIIEITKDDTKAKVTVQCIRHPKQNAVGLTITHTLIKEDGKWRINLDDELPAP